MKFEITCTIKEVSVDDRSGVKDGVAWRMRNQPVWADMGKEFPQEIMIALGDNDEAYLPGRYRIDPECLYIARYGKLALGKIKLLPLAAAAAAKTG